MRDLHGDAGGVGAGKGGAGARGPGWSHASVEEFGHDEAAEGVVAVDRVLFLAEGGSLMSRAVGDPGSQVDRLHAAAPMTSWAAKKTSGSDMPGTRCGGNGASTRSPRAAVWS